MSPSTAFISPANSPASRIAYLVTPHLPVAVERRERPSLASRPVVIADDALRAGAGVLDCSLEALDAGVRAGMAVEPRRTSLPRGDFPPAPAEPLPHRRGRALRAAQRSDAAGGAGSAGRAVRWTCAAWKEKMPRRWPSVTANVKLSDASCACPAPPGWRSTSSAPRRHR
ncbi:MAG: hypothetical protein V9H69_17310 [Anaerolineae bacterium]